VTTRPKSNLTVEEYLKAYRDAPGRYELVSGHVVKLAAETARHVRLKGKIFRALSAAIERKGLDCEAFQDGISVKISTNTAREPDVSVQCGKSLSDESLVLDRPLILVEVVSPGSATKDESQKLAEYFRLPTVMHYLIVWPNERMCYHHKRLADGKVLTTIVRSGKVEFEPPGMLLSIKDIFGELDR
jgi:Uma2 family endonuclease